MKVGASGGPEIREVKERLARLRRYRWSSYRAYVGLGKRPDWLECDRVLELGRGKKDERVRKYRDYVERAVRVGLAKSPWEELQDQVVLGGEQFLQKLRAHVSGNAREQPGAKRLSRARPKLEEVIASLEKIRGQPWTEFRDRHGDKGRDLVLYVGQRLCGQRLRELAAAVGMNDYGAVSIATRRFEEQLQRHKPLRAQLKQVCQLLNVEM